ncbi:MAG: diadenylate cyclase CdaA [Syntrophomonadales bacterium]
MNLEVLAALASDPVKLLINLADILIVSYVCYRLLLLIRGTRAEQLLKGVIVLLLFSAVSRWLGFSAVNWLINKVWTGIFIALPVVFQPELRRALEQLGRGSFFSSRMTEKTPDMDRHIEEVVKATTELSRFRIGALIVWRRETGIDDYSEIGVDIDAAISAELLINIFTPNTPLHDGAVIINQGRIHRAGAFLPLSDNPNLDKSMGTRHRAAVGISEVSDALAIVVSEETGSLALAREGVIMRPLDVPRLREMLTQELRDQYPRKQTIWRKREVKNGE